MALSETEIITYIRQGGRLREKALSEILSWHDIIRQARSYISRYKGNEQDVEDVFSEAVITMDRNIRAGKFTHTGSLKGYMNTTVKNIWRNRFRKDKNVDYRDDMISVVEADSIIDKPDTEYRDEQLRVVMKHFEGLSPKCRTILKYWMLDYSTEEMMDTMELTSLDVTRRKKYLCLKELKQQVAAAL